MAAFFVLKYHLRLNPYRLNYIYELAGIFLYSREHRFNSNYVGCCLGFFLNNQGKQSRKGNGSAVQSCGASMG